MDDRTLALGEIAWDALRRLARERLARKAGGHLVEAQLDRMVLRLPIPVRDEGDGAESFARTVAAAIDRHLDEAIEHAAAFRPGRAFCHRCGGPGCEHSEPPSARHVVAGYTPTGVPRWEDFAQVCLERRHPEVDRLFEDPPAFVAIVLGRDALHGRFVDAFHTGAAYDLVGQVAAGFWRTPVRVGEGRGVLALTFQVGVSRPRDGAPRFGLNLLGRTPQGGALESLWERQDDIPWRGAVRWAQAALAGLRRADRSEGRVEGILQGLARRLERDARARGRRTRHAESRHLSGERPTRMALEDARRADAGSVLFDEKHGTFVVPGERGRTHFFTAEGRLVSSVRYSGDALDRKRKLGFWRPAPAEEAETLLKRIRAVLPSGATEEAACKS
ncbi:MAG TPA: hypothetical protein VF139_16485 [Candidatus Polarisedimenticolaceae bacterium]